MEYQILCKRIKSLGLEPIIHALLWIFFIAGEVFSLALLTGGYSTVEHYLFFYSLNILLFYSYVWLLFKVPEKESKGWLWALVIFTVMLFLYVVLAGQITNLLNDLPGDNEAVDVYKRKFIVSTSWRGIYFMIFATGFVLLKRNSKRKMNELAKVVEIERLQGQLLSAEKDYLRSQINPHFLFNTLSFISHAIKHHPENARLALGILSDIMDYALDCTNGDSGLLSQEVEQIENMIALIQLRYGDKLNLVFKNPTDCGKITIAPLILLTLVENVFKHGNLLHKSIPTTIELSCSGDAVTFMTTNPVQKSMLSKGKSTGLRNIKTRLINSYPDKHSFKFGHEGDIFKTELIINYNPSTNSAALASKLL